MQKTDLEEAENFVTATSIVISNQAYTRYIELSNQSIYHYITKSDNFLATARYALDRFQDILLDIEAARISIAGYSQTKAYIREFDIYLDTTSADSVTAHFKIDLAVSIKKLTVDSPISRIEFHIIQANTPFLLYLQNINRLRIYLNNLEDRIVLRNESTVPIVRFHEHPFLI